MFDDTGHRPHASFKGETPSTDIARGPEALRVRLVSWEPKHHIAHVYNALQANWGDAPSNLIQDEVGGNLWWPQDGDLWPVDPDEDKRIRAYVAKCFAGGTLPQILEEFRFHFVIDGVTRACTHQLVRTRGADVMQHGGRDNDWRHRGWTLPETIARADEQMRSQLVGTDRAHCITDWGPIVAYLQSDADRHGWGLPRTLRAAIEDHLFEGKLLYAALVDAGIPWQDARRVLTMGSQTYLHIGYNYLDLQRTLANRLEHIMDWEFNCVAQLMLREVVLACPRYMTDPLRSASDKAHMAMFAGLTSWPPDGKWPVLEEFQGLPRTHRPEQMPYWILAPESFTPGQPVRWIPTNGVWPDDVPRERL